MFCKHISITSLLLFASFFCFAQKDTCRFVLVDTVSSVDTSYYMASNVNGWDPKDENFKFRKDKDGTNYLICYFDKATLLEYKFTKGGWDRVECGKNGTEIENHKLRSDTVKSSVNYIQGWKNSFATETIKHTASSNVRIIDTAFYIPQLDKKRRVWIYLPENYSVSGKRFPVLYMQDGQNVFDAATSGYGEWGVDECLDSLNGKGRSGCIVVAIDNGGETRLSEYNPYEFILKDSLISRVFKPQGNEYLAFLVHTLKSFIDKHYRTIKDKEHTIIAGSSMGGVISYYAMLKYPDVFGKAGIFSPAFWTAPKLLQATDSLGGKVTGKIFFYMGEKEGREDLDYMFDVQKRLALHSSAFIYSVTDPEARHNEKAWHKWFPEFYLWIMADGFNNVPEVGE
jgi:predicted alpha/beta superfamily hydrolase